MMKAYRALVKRISKLGRRRSYALNDLDLKLARRLDYRGGVFVEAGANDGLRQSNTRYFEKYQGWSGLLVEPIPELAQQCARNRRQCIVENCALVPFDYNREFVEMTYCGLMSTVRGAMKSETEEQEHIRKGCDVQQVQAQAVTVRAATLSALFDKHALTHIDLLSLDVEGYELQALRGLDFTRHRPRFMLIEARYRDDIDNFLKPWCEPVEQLSHHDVLYRMKDL